jgi:hypothetical protein
MLDCAAQNWGFWAVAGRSVTAIDGCSFCCTDWGLPPGRVRREGNAPSEVGPEPNYIGEDLDVIDQVIESYLVAAKDSR